MKLYIRAFAYSRKKARETINSYAKKLNEHVIKCIIFGKYRPRSKEHWIEEIVNWIVECDKKHIYEANLKDKDYRETIFEFFPDDLEETRYGLIHFEKTNLEEHHDAEDALPYFSISSSMVSLVFRCCEDLKDVCIPRLKKHVFHDRTSWRTIIRSIINTYLYDFKKEDIVDSTHGLY